MKLLSTEEWTKYKPEARAILQLAQPKGITYEPESGTSAEIKPGGAMTLGFPVSRSLLQLLKLAKTPLQLRSCSKYKVECVCVHRVQRQKLMLLLHVFVLDLVLLVFTLYSLKDMVEWFKYPYHSGQLPSQLSNFLPYLHWVFTSGHREAGLMPCRGGVNLKGPTFLHRKAMRAAGY